MDITCAIPQFLYLLHVYDNSDNRLIAELYFLYPNQALEAAKSWQEKNGMDITSYAVSELAIEHTRHLAVSNLKSGYELDMDGKLVMPQAK